MSWMKDSLLGGTPAPYQDKTSPEEKVKDPAIADRLVSTKAANQPFLAYKKYREEQEALHEAWLVKKKEHDEKIARGEKVGRLEPDPTAEQEIGLLGLLKFLVYLLIAISLAGKFFTGSFTWEYEGKWTQLKTFWPTDQRLFSERLLSEFDGSKPDKPIYLAIDGDVFDVSKNPKSYGPGGSYHLMTGVDAARSFGTGCFKTHRTHDLRGLTEAELRGVAHWKKFFAEHKDYRKVGRVIHPPIDPASPIPEHCDPKKRHTEEVKKGTKEGGTYPPEKSEDKGSQHKEL